MGLCKFQKNDTTEKINNLISIFGEEVLEELLENGEIEDSRGWKLLLNNIGGYYLANEKTSIKRIYFVGPCVVRGVGCLSKDSLVANIQNLVKDDGYMWLQIAHSQGGIRLLKKYYVKFL